MSFPFFHRKAPERALFAFLGTLSPAFLLKNAENFRGESAAALLARAASAPSGEESPGIGRPVSGKEKGAPAKMKILWENPQKGGDKLPKL